MTVAGVLAAEAQRRREGFRRALLWSTGVLAVLWFTAAQIGLNPAALVRGVPFMLDFFGRMFPPDLAHLALLGARNTTPHVLVFHATRMFLNALRSINELVFALIFVAAVGLGPFAGVLAIALHATGMLAKFCAEEVEGVDRGPIEAMRATGAGRLQVILFGIVPQVVPAFVSYSVYRFDVSIRAATILGLVGAGGLGFSLIKTMKLFLYHQTATCILVIFVLVAVSDWLCARIRARIL